MRLRFALECDRLTVKVPHIETDNDSEFAKYYKDLTDINLKSLEVRVFRRLLRTFDSTMAEIQVILGRDYEKNNKDL